MCLRGKKQQKCRVDRRILDSVFDDDMIDNVNRNHFERKTFRI